MINISMIAIARNYQKANLHYQYVDNTDAGELESCAADFDAVQTNIDLYLDTLYDTLTGYEQLEHVILLFMLLSGISSTIHLIKQDILQKIESLTNQE